MAKLQYLVIHCTATPEDREVTVFDIRTWHTSPPPVGRGWRQMGYTDMFHLDGTVERLVPNNGDDTVDPWEITNGVAGINSISRHIVYVGGLDDTGKRPKDTRTIGQSIALEQYVKDFVARHPRIKVAGHSQFAAKACPCFDVPEWCREIGIEPKNIYRP